MPGNKRPQLLYHQPQAGGGVGDHFGGLFWIRLHDSHARFQIETHRVNGLDATVVHVLEQAFSFFGKAVLLAHANTAAFNETGRRLFGAPWIQWLIWEKNKDRVLSASKERAAEKRRRAVLTGEAEEAA